MGTISEDHVASVIALAMCLIMIAVLLVVSGAIPMWAIREALFGIAGEGRC